MSRKKFFIALTNFMLAVFVTVTVTVAWFIAVAQNRVDMPSLNLESPIVKYYEIYFYTVDSVYKYSSQAKETYVYDPISETWIEPEYFDSEESDKSFVGIIMGQYDPLIEANNIYNNLIIEMKIVYDTTQDVIGNVSSVSKTSLAQSAIEILSPNSSHYGYLSRFVFLQQRKNMPKISHNDNENIYFTVTEMFEEDYDTYPLLSFYDGEVYNSGVNLGDIEFDADKTVTYLYFNISYNEDKIVETFSTVWASDTTFKKTIYLFQDITFLIKE